MKRSWKHLIGLGLGLGLLGCGSDPAGGGDDGPDGGIDTLPGDTTAPQLVSSSPEANAERVSVLGSVSVVFDEPLDPATLDAALSVRGGQFADRLHGTVTYDATTYALTFTPQQPLVHGDKIVLRVSSAITDLAGNAFAGAEIPFLTHVNGATRAVYRTGAGIVTGWTTAQIDLNGRSTQELAFSASGPDQVWLNADDVVSGRADFTYTDAGGSHHERYFNRGPDAVFGTGDDVVASMTIRHYDSRDRRTGHTNYSAPGDDEIWGTADDVILSIIVYTWEGDNYVHRVSYNGPGDDLMWRTADDRVSTFTLRTHAANGELVREISFQPGADLRAFTADDVVTGYSDHVHTAGYLTRTLIRTAGEDGTWLTADDAYFRWYEYDRDANGLMVDYKQIDTAGDDGVWLTSDDPVVARNLYTYDANGQRVTERHVSGPGQDMTWRTGDDVVIGHVLTLYDATGNRVSSRTFGHPGSDGLWLTLDDRVTVESDYDTVH